VCPVREETSPAEEDNQGRQDRVRPVGAAGLFLLHLVEAGQEGLRAEVGRRLVGSQ